MQEAGKSNVCRADVPVGAQRPEAAVEQGRPDGPVGGLSGRRIPLDLGRVSLSVLFRPSMGWVMPTCMGGGQCALFSLLIHMLTSSRNTLTDTPRMLFGQTPGHL